MTEWREVALGDLCERVTVGHVGKMADRYVDDGVPFLRSQNIKPFRVDTKGMLRIDESFHAKLSKSELRSGDVAIVRTGYPGTAAVVPDSLDRSNCADLVIVTPSDELNPHILAAILNSSWGRSTVSGHLVGSAQQHFNVGSARSLRVRLPSRRVQDRIASVLCALNDGIENNWQRVVVLEQVARLIYQEWFVHFRFPGHEDTTFVDTDHGPVPHGWAVSVLDAIVEQRRATVGPGDVDDDTPLVGLEHIPRRQLTLDDWAMAGGVGSRKTRFEAGDILFGKIRPYFHKVALAPIAGICSTDALVLDASGPHRGLAIMALSSDELVAYATQTANGTKMPRANWEVMKSHPVVLPPEQLTVRFSGLIDDLCGMATLLMFGAKRLEEMRDLLLPKLVAGKIDVSDLDLDVVLGEARI